MSTVADRLRAACTRITNPSAWTRGSYARDADGKPAYASSKPPVCWCAYGALYAEGAEDECPEVRLLRRAALEVHASVPIDVNDDLGHAAVLRMYDRAIELADAGARS